MGNTYKIINGIDYLIEKYMSVDKISFYRSKTISMEASGDLCGRVLLKQNLILINKDEIVENQIMEFLHQIIHNHPVFCYYTFGEGSIYFKGHIFYKREFMEKQIEKLAQETYQNKPDVVERIKELIQKSKISI